MLECYADIYYVYMVLQKDLSVRLKVESFATLLRSGFTWILLTNNFHLFSYAIGQLAFSSMLCFGYRFLLLQQLPRIETAHLPQISEILVVFPFPERLEDKNSKNYYFPYVLDTHAELLLEFTKAAAVKFTAS